MDQIVKIEENYRKGVAITIHSKDAGLVSLLNSYIEKKLMLLKKAGYVKSIANRVDVIIVVLPRGVTPQEFMVVFKKISPTLSQYI